jgi:ribosome maturation protein SDO1
LALDESRYSVDPFKRLDDQVKDALELLKPMIPLSFESIRLAIRVPGSAYGSASRILRPYLEKEQWLENGSWAGIIEIPAGMKDTIIGKLMNQSSDTECKEL